MLFGNSTTLRMKFVVKFIIKSAPRELKSGEKKKKKLPGNTKTTSSQQDYMQNIVKSLVIINTNVVFSLF